MVEAQTCQMEELQAGLNMKKAFFACSMRGGYSSVSFEFLQQIPQALKDMGFELASEHQTQPDIIQKESLLPNALIYQRDISLLKQSDTLIAEMSNPSMGVGGEITDAISLGKPVLGLYQIPQDKVSSYILGKIEGHSKGRHAHYTDLRDLKLKIKDFINYLGWSRPSKGPLGILEPLGDAPGYYPQKPGDK